MKSLIGLFLGFLVLVFFLFYFMAMAQNSKTEVKNGRIYVAGGSGSGAIHVVEYDNCEYVLYNRGIAHKGNCKYCAERNKK